MHRSKILLVDDDVFILKGIGKDLESEGYQVTAAKSGKEAIRLLDQKSYDLVITDLVMDDIDGLQVLKRAKAAGSDTMVLILTGYADLASAIDALRLNADDYLLKPCDPEEIFFRVSRCLERLELRRKIKIYEKILPVCCVCKNIRDDTSDKPGRGEWRSFENYLVKKAKIDITSTYCPECFQKVKKELDEL
jgi:DNA-binding response OmpR family regulator